MVDLSPKERGLVTTPESTCSFMVKLLGNIKQDAKILDPCVGLGAFPKALINAGISPKQITAFDIEDSYRDIIEDMEVYFVSKDTLLSIHPFEHGRYDIVIGNPPYLSKASTYIQKNKETLKKIYGHIHTHEAYAMFIVNALRRLKNKGKLVFIVSDSFMTLNTHYSLRSMILRTCKIDEIILAPKSLFDHQNVSTSPAILVLTKCVGRKNQNVRESHQMRIVDRLQSEADYEKPKTVYTIPQKCYNYLPYSVFFVGLEKGIIDFFRYSMRLEICLKGYIGMHTKKNEECIRSVDGELVTLSNEWKPYLKKGGSEQYYRPVFEYVSWKPEDVATYSIPKDAPFGHEGIVISGISSRLAARYMPEGCYWDSNKAIGFILVNKHISIEYMLGLLNSSLYNYLAKKVLNRTNSLQLSDIHALPYIAPDEDIKSRVEKLVATILKEKKKNLNYDYTREQKQIDDIIFTMHQQRFNLKRKY